MSWYYKKRKSGENLGNVAMQVLYNISEGNSPIEHIDYLPGVYDVTDYAPGTKINTSHAANESKRALMRTDYRTSDLLKGTELEDVPVIDYSTRDGVIFFTYYDEETDEYVNGSVNYIATYDDNDQVTYKRDGEPYLDTSRMHASVAGTRKFYQDFVPAEDQVYVSNYQYGDFKEGKSWHNYSAFAEWDERSGKTMAHWQQTGEYSWKGEDVPKILWSDLVSEGYIKKVGDRFVLVDLYNLDENSDVEFLTADEFFASLNKKNENATGLSDWQAMMEYLSNGTYELTGKHAGQEIDMLEVRAQAIREVKDLYGTDELGSHTKFGTEFGTPKNEAYNVESIFDEEMLKVTGKDDPYAESALYWADKQLDEQRRIDDAHLKADLEVQRIQAECTKNINEKVSDFYSQLTPGITEQELQAMPEYQTLMADVQHEMEEAAKSSLATIQGALEETAEIKMPELDRYNIEALANTEYNGLHYSDRLWANTTDVTSKLQATITQDLLEGKDPTEDIKAGVRTETNDDLRILRTETARVDAKGTELQMADAGIQEIEILVEPDACDTCAALVGKKWQVGHEPSLPIHPNCRCQYLPVVK